MNDKKLLVYVIKCELNNKFYVGITNDLTKRWNKHVYDAKHNSPCVIHRAMRKYGLENFSITEIQQSSSKEELCKLEQFYIRELETHVSCGGYNETFGGEAPMLGRKHSKKTRLLISKRMKGRSSPNKGKFASNETKQKISETHSKSVLQINLEGITVATYRSITEASKAIGVAGTNITKVCRGKKKTAGGFRWQYSENK